MLSVRLGGRDDLPGQPCTVRRLFDCRRNLIERCCGLFQTGSLLFCPTGEVVRRLSDFFGARPDTLGSAGDDPDRFAQCVNGDVEIFAQLFVVLSKWLVQADDKITARQPL